MTQVNATEPIPQRIFGTVTLVVAQRACNGYPRDALRKGEPLAAVFKRFGIL